MDAADQIVSIFAASEGYLDDIDLRDCARFEAELLPYVHRRYPEFASAISAGGKMSTEQVARLRTCIETFKKAF